jgi:hypothetical protein
MPVLLIALQLTAREATPNMSVAGTQQAPRVSAFLRSFQGGTDYGIHRPDPGQEKFNSRLVALTTEGQPGQQVPAGSSGWPSFPT